MFAIKSVSLSRYLSCNAAGKVTVRAAGIGADEKWNFFIPDAERPGLWREYDGQLSHLMTNGIPRVSIRSLQGLWLSARPEDENYRVIGVRGDEPGRWEEWEIKALGGSTFAIQSFIWGRYLPGVGGDVDTVPDRTDRCIWEIELVA